MSTDHVPPVKPAVLQGVPNIPVRLAGRPTVGGLVVPWTTIRTPDGRYKFGGVDLDRHRLALTQRLCQICGAPLETRLVFAMRDRDLRMMTSHEPAMHPVCAAYAAKACPMLAGRLSHYRATALAAQLADIAAHGDPTGVRAGATAEPWQLVWATGYRVFSHSRTQTLAALLLAEQILRIRVISDSRNHGISA